MFVQLLVLLPVIFGATVDEFELINLEGPIPTCTTSGATFRIRPGSGYTVTTSPTDAPILTQVVSSSKTLEFRANAAFSGALLIDITLPADKLASISCSVGDVETVVIVDGAFSKANINILASGKCKMFVQGLQVPSFSSIIASGVSSTKIMFASDIQTDSISVSGGAVVEIESTAKITLNNNGATSVTGTGSKLSIKSTGSTPSVFGSLNVNSNGELNIEATGCTAAFLGLESGARGYTTCTVDSDNVNGGTKETSPIAISSGVTAATRAASTSCSSSANFPTGGGSDNWATAPGYSVWVLVTALACCLQVLL